MGAKITAYDQLGRGLDMSGFTNGVGRFDAGDTWMGREEVPVNDYTEFELEGTGPYFVDGLENRNSGMEFSGIISRDAGSKTFVAHVVYMDEEYNPTLAFMNVDVLVPDGFLKGSPVTVSALTGNDEIAGNKFSDILKGGDGNDKIRGNAGNDRLFGERGNDTLNGNGGSDTLIGGTGRDVFVFDTTGFKRGVDRITDFSVTDDTIRLDDKAFTGLTIGALGSAAFARNTSGSAQDASDRVIYETDTGNLYFDADGKGGAAKVHFATLDDRLALTSADFLVF